MLEETANTSKEIKKKYADYFVEMRTLRDKKKQSKMRTKKWNKYETDKRQKNVIIKSLEGIKEEVNETAERAVKKMHWNNNTGTQVLYIIEMTKSQ